MENGTNDTNNFDLSSDVSSNYFKSSFARSIALTNTAQSKSLDYVYLDDGATISEESEADIMSRIQNCMPRKPRRSVPTLPTYDPAYPKDYSSVRRNRTNDAIKFWKMRQESAIKQAEQSTWKNKEQQNSTLVPEETKEEEILRLRKECQGLMEANRKLQAGGTSIDTSLLQTQIDTLQWQLEQAESNRQMYRAVMEQVSKFLERVHKAMESSPTKGSTRGKSRVPRSRSVHTVVTSQSRASSPSPAHSANVHRANSISQMQDSYSTLRDYTWRGSRSMIEEGSPERLSQDAFRLLRTIQSLLGTREPDLARVSDQAQRRDSTSMGSCSSLVVPSVIGGCETVESDGKSSTGSTSSASGVTPSAVSCGGTGSSSSSSSTTGTSGGLVTPQPSVSSHGSTEDESGFSSMSSFHEVTTTTTNSSPSHLLHHSHHHHTHPLLNNLHHHHHHLHQAAGSNGGGVASSSCSSSSSCASNGSISAASNGLLEGNNGGTAAAASSAGNVGGVSTTTSTGGTISAANGSSSSSNNNNNNTSINSANSGSHHELGLPLVTPDHHGTRHRRWSSTPVEAGYTQPLRVLWV